MKTCPCFRILALLVGMSVVLKSNADRSVDDLFELTLQQLMSITVASPTLSDRNLTSTPASITVISRQQIEHLGFNYLHEVLSLVPGYQSFRGMDYSYEYVTSARARRSGIVGRSILFLLDGRPFNDPRNSSEESLYLYPTSFIERLEVIRGPGSAIYGSNAFTGVVNIISRQSVSKAVVGVGDFESKKLEVFSHHHMDQWQLSFGAYHKQDEGQLYKLPDTFSNETLDVRDPWNHSQFQFQASRHETHLNIVYRDISADDFINTGRISNQYNFSEQSSYFIGLQQGFHINEQFESKFLMDYFYSESRNGNQSTAEGVFSAISDPISDEPLFGYGEFESHHLSVASQNSWEFDENNSLQFGFEWVHRKLDKARGYTNFDLNDILTNTIPIQYYPNLSSGQLLTTETDLDSHGIYAQYQGNWSDKWELIAGARYDNYKNFSGHTSPRLALIHHLPHQTHLKILYGEAYRAPVISELDSVNTITIKGNPDLQPEVIKTTEIILMKQWPQSQFQLTVFDNHIQDPVISTTINSVRSYSNGGDESSQGGELEVQYQPNKDWLIRLGVTEFWKLPESAYRESSSLLSLQAGYNSGQWDANVALIYNNERESSATSGERLVLDRVYHLSSKVSYQFSHHWKFAIYGKNLLDEEVIHPGEGTQMDIGVPDRGRSMGIDVQFAWD